MCNLCVVVLLCWCCFWLPMVLFSQSDSIFNFFLAVSMFGFFFCSFLYRMHFKCFWLEKAKGETKTWKLAKEKVTCFSSFSTFWPETRKIRWSIQISVKIYNEDLFGYGFFFLLLFHSLYICVPASNFFHVQIVSRFFFIFFFTDLPKFGEPLQNITIPVGREALLSCVVDNLQTYKVIETQFLCYFCAFCFYHFRLSLLFRYVFYVRRRGRKMMYTTAWTVYLMGAHDNDTL